MALPGPGARRNLRGVFMLPHELFFAGLAFVLGACIGSFLNVCIYRIPRDLSVNQPRRSFCPSCKYQIPWHRNLPLFSWLALRGKCANCAAPIAFRYFGVELLTGVLFLAVWLLEPSALALPLVVLIALLVVATFIDFEHFIIPDEITWGGAAAGLVLSCVFPQLHRVSSFLEGAMWSAIGGVGGYLLLWGVVEGGKLAFGKKAFALREPAPFTWTRRPVQTEHGEESDADLVAAETTWTWSDTFSRESDELTMTCPRAAVDGEELGESTLRFSYDKLRVGERTWVLDQVDRIQGIVARLVIPREAMGFGDVKFMACIGAFLGWQGMLFTLVAACMSGALVGVATIVMGRREWSARIPFGPYLSLGALVWIFAGPQLVARYWAFMHPAF
jgi:leader peptidase (prepilin peptidase) / N-methyltransferase